MNSITTLQKNSSTASNDSSAREIEELNTELVQLDAELARRDAEKLVNKKKLEVLQSCYLSKESTIRGFVGKMKRKKRSMEKCVVKKNSRSALLSLPDAILSIVVGKIISSSSTNDTLALASTCRRLREHVIIETEFFLGMQMHYCWLLHCWRRIIIRRPQLVNFMEKLNHNRIREFLKNDNRLVFYKDEVIAVIKSNLYSRRSIKDFRAEYYTIREYIDACADEVRFSVNNITPNNPSNNSRGVVLEVKIIADRRECTAIIFCKVLDKLPTMICIIDEHSVHTVDVIIALLQTPLFLSAYREICKKKLSDDWIRENVVGIDLESESARLRWSPVRTQWEDILPLDGSVMEIVAKGKYTATDKLLRGSRSLLWPRVLVEYVNLIFVNLT